MRRSQAALIALLACSPVSGCLPARHGADSALAARKLPDGGAEIVRIDVAVVERPPGDRYLNHALWDLADEQTVDLERKPVLDDNGFRVGIIGGMVPSDLLALLTSDRSCADPHRIQLRAGSPSPIAMGPDHAHCNFGLCQGGQTVPVSLDDARCLLAIVPTPAEDGRITLRFTPVVKHGKSQRVPRAVRDPSGEHRWDMEVQQSTESYAALSWEVTVSPEEYVVVGTRLDRDDTLGKRFFLDTESTTATQRLLVIRGGRVPSEALPTEPGARGAVPLALQAGWRLARGRPPAAD